MASSLLCNLNGMENMIPTGKGETHGIRGLQSGNRIMAISGLKFTRLQVGVGAYLFIIIYVTEFQKKN